MKQLVTVILILVLVVAFAGSLIEGTMASFFDTGVSTDNKMCAGTRNLELSSGSIIVECAVPSKWYSQVFNLINAGTLEGVVTVHILEEGFESVEAGAKDGLVWNGSAYLSGNPVGAGTATSEPELVSEEGGQVGHITVSGLGVDAGSDSGPADLVMSKHIDIKIWFDENGDGVFSDDELRVSDKLFNVICTTYDLGVFPPAPGFTQGRGGGWGSYFTYNIDSQEVELPLMCGRNDEAGSVFVWNDATHLYVKYDTTEPEYSGWEMAVTHVYVGTDPPEKLAPGNFPYQCEHNPGVTECLYQIPLDGLSGKIYIAAHAEGTDGETGWGTREYGIMKVELHLQQVEDPAWPVDYDGDGDIDDDDEQKKWWPTNVFQGDYCTFDMLIELKK